MFRLYSKGCEYAIRALLDVASHGQDSYVAIRDICRRARLPESSTRKMVQALAQQRLLRSIPGPHGGYQLARPPDQISILDVIEVIDGTGAFKACVLGLPACRDEAPCALHPTWEETTRALLPTLGRLTLRDLAATMRVAAASSDAIRRRRQG